MKKIVLVEDHHQALGIWHKRNFKNYPLVHLDRHIDFDFYRVNPLPQVVAEAKSIPALKAGIRKSLFYKKYKIGFERQLHFGNYIYPAIRDGIVKKFYWVVPGRIEQFRAGLSRLKHAIRILKAKDPFGDEKIILKGGSIETKLYGRYFKAADLFSLRRIDEPVLLDIDVDYLLFDSIEDALSPGKTGMRKPWIYPDLLARLVKNKFTNLACVTISYSVNGGFTPLEFKFLGDEIALRLSRKDLSVGLRKLFYLRGQAVGGYFKKQRLASMRDFKKLLALLDDVKGMDGNFKSRFKAHLFFWLFKLHWESKRYACARRYYKNAVFNDPSYRINENNHAWLYPIKDYRSSAAIEFKRILCCDPYNQFALCGLARVFLGSGKLDPAKKLLMKALRDDPLNKEIISSIINVCLRKKDFKNAELFLSRLKDIAPKDMQVLLLEAELNASQGNPEQALNIYKDILLAGLNSASIYKSIFKILKDKNHPEESFFVKKYRLFRKSIAITNNWFVPIPQK